MQISSKIKIGPILVISSVLALWTLLAVQHVQAHTSSEPLPTPSCSNLPATAFFDVTPAITNGTVLAAQVTKQGGSVTDRGDSKYRYARITIPALAAGELRVFDDNANGPSDAVLCRGSTQVARSITSYSAHNSAHSAAAAATRAATAANTVWLRNNPTPGDITPGDNTDDTTTDAAPDISTVSAASSVLSRVRSGLISARSALGTAARALNTAAAANPVAADRTTIEGYATAARNAEQRALSIYNNRTDNTTLAGTVPADSTDLTVVQTALTTALTELGTARDALTTAATNLGTNTAPLAHEGFQLRAAVAPGDEEYILVVAPQSAGTALPFSAQFHGAIAASDVKRNRSLSAGETDTITITITAPGLLTLETTGSTDTVGTLDGDTGGTRFEVAYAESGGSGGNFKIVAPVRGTTHELEVDGQDTREDGAYTLDMDFKVAMQTGAAGAGITFVAAPTWTTSVPADDTTVQIQRRAADGNVADEDYFLFTPDNSGLLTVNANDDNTAASDANTRGTLFGAMGQGPEMSRRAGQIATDDNSGPGGTHFHFAVPVEGGRDYLVKVEGTDGVYALEFELTTATTDPDSDTNTAALSFPITLPHPSISGALSARERDRYLFNIEEPGTLYMETSGPTDVVGYLSGPDGSLVADDDNSGTGTNFRIAVNVAPGLYILEVEGQTAQTVGNYTLVSSFVAGPGPEPPTEPTTPVDPDPDPEPDTDATGGLDNPRNNSTRSGIGVINGWVCQADEVTITITQVGSTSGTRFNIGYGGNRPDTVGECDHTSANTGFAMAYNYNNLDEGEYEIEARADGELINTTARRFTVIHLVPGNPFPRNLEGGATVLDFPTAGETTTLEWETSSQGFVITDVQ